jgi:hypothetical protein
LCVSFLLKLNLFLSICYMCYLYLKFKLKIKGIFGKKSLNQKCAEEGSFLSIAP